MASVGNLSFDTNIYIYIATSFFSSAKGNVAKEGICVWGLQRETYFMEEDICNQLVQLRGKQYGITG